MKNRHFLGLGLPFLYCVLAGFLAAARLAAVEKDEWATRTLLKNSLAVFVDLGANCAANSQFSVVIDESK